MTEIVPVRIIDPDDRVRELIDRFLRTRESDHTTDAYRIDIAKWINWCANQEPPVEPLAARHANVHEWISSLRRLDRPESDPTRARRLAAVSSWYEWLLREGTVAYNPARLQTNERPKPRRESSPTAHLSPKQVDALLAAADEDPDPRTAALVWLLTYTGARVGEVVAADVEDLGYEEEDRVLPITGKGRRKRSLPLEPPVAERLDRYLVNRDQSVSSDRLPTRTAGAKPRRPLFLNDRGRRMTRQSARYILRKVAKASGIPPQLVEHLSPHSLRHTYATTLLRNKVPVRDVQYSMGHADARTTEWYDHGKPEDHPTRKLAEILGRQRAAAEGSTDSAC